MASVTRLQILRGTTAERLSFVPLKGELVMDTDTNFLYIGDGITAGGVLAAPLAANTNKVIAIVRNETGSTILKGTPVHIVSATPGGVPLIQIARADDLAKLPASGILETDILNNSTGVMVIIGEVGGLNTSSFSPGDVIYVAPTGGLTNVQPVEPNFIQSVAVCESSNATTGSILIHSRPSPKFTNLPNNHVVIGVTGSNPTTVDFSSKVLSTILAGLSLATATAITAADSVLSAFGKLQAQITVLFNRNINSGYGLTGGGNLTVDRTLAVSLSNFYDSSSTPFVTNSVTDVAIDNLSRTPAAGTYLVLVNADGDFDTNNRVSTISIYGGGVQVPSTERNNNHLDQTQQAQMSTNCVVTVDGSQAIDARVRVSGGNLTVGNRSMTLVRLA